MRTLTFLAVVALCAPAPAGEEPRGVIAFYDSSGRGDELDTHDPIHQLFEMPLNYLGMIVWRHDIRRGPPPKAWLSGARAVLTYFEGSRDCPAWLWPWLEKHVPARGLRVVHIGDFGPLADGPEGQEGEKRLAAWLLRFGLDHDGTYRRGPVGLKISTRSAELCAFEADPRVRAVHLGPQSRAATNRPWVETESVWEEGIKRAPVVTGPWGGLALDPWGVFPGGERDRRWHVDPFVFFREALGLEGVPAPHPQVLFGRRMFFVQVDGDGFESVTRVRRGARNSVVFADDVLKRYELPFTVSIIVRSLTADYDAGTVTPRMREAREIFALKNVEPASHTVLHPLRWDRGENWYDGLAHYTFSPVGEVRDSLRFIRRHLLGDDRGCSVLLWSGVANPPAEAILACGREGASNLNGGVFRWDAQTDSVAFVTPWSRRLGDRAVQVYAGAANENDFPGYFTTMPGAFAHVTTTIERCGTPRILKPANVYCHFFSAETPARLAALHKLLRRWGLEEPVAPVFASTYARAVHSALTGARIVRTPNGWRLVDFGDCPTARIDGETREIDWHRSRGLVGVRRANGSLYLHLGASEAEVVFADRPVPHAYVEQANHRLTAVEIARRHVHFRSASHARREVVCAGFPPDSAVEVTTAAGRDWTLRADAAGRVHVEVGGPGSDSVLVVAKR